MIEIQARTPEVRFEPSTETSLRERQRRAWDGVAASVRDFSGAPSTRYYRRCEIALIESALGDLRGKKILKLDLWNEAFNTRILDWMRAQGAEVVGLDLSRVVAERARRNAAAALRRTQGAIGNITDIHAERPLKNFVVYSVA